MLLILIGIILHTYKLHKPMKKFFEINKTDYIFITLKSLINCLGPFYGIIRIFLKLLGIKKLEFNKTKH